MGLGFAGVATVPLSFRHFSATLFACPPRLWLCLVRKCCLRAWQQAVFKRWRVAVCALGFVVLVLTVDRVWAPRSRRPPVSAMFQLFSLQTVPNSQQFDQRLAGALLRVATLPVPPALCAAGCCFEGSPMLHCNRRPKPLASHSAWRTLRVPTFRAASSPPSRGRVSQEAPSRLGGKHRPALMHMSRCCQRTAARPALGRPWWVAGMGEFATAWHVQRPSKPRRATAASNCNVVRVTGAMALQDRRADQPARQCGAKLH